MSKAAQPEPGQENSEMTNEGYLLTQQYLLTLAMVVRRMDLTGFLARIGCCEAAGPILDPTLYIKGADNLEAIKMLAQGALAFQRAINEVEAKGR